MAISEIYVDPSIAADSGAGTSGDPYGDLEYAIEQETFDTTNGTRINIKAGTDEVLAADLTTALLDTSVSVAWSVSEAAPLYIQGYTATAGDGGIGGISGGAGNFPILTAAGTQRYVTFLDMHLHNTGTALVLDLNNYSNVIRCEIDNSTGGGILGDLYCSILNCYIHNTASIGAQLSSGIIAYNWFENGVNNFTYALKSASTTTLNNIIIVDGASNGMDAGDFGWIIGNSIYGGGSSGAGISVGTAQGCNMIANNLIEGFSGTGGDAIDFVAASSYVRFFRNNSEYDNTNGIETPTITPAENSGNEALTASPFTDAAGGNFQPVDTGLVKEGSWPATFTNA